MSLTQFIVIRGDLLSKLNWPVGSVIGTHPFSPSKERTIRNSGATAMSLGPVNSSQKKK